MSPELILTIFQRAVEVILVVSLIILIPALIVGLSVSMFQAATQINEMTLSFIPKLIVTLLVLTLAGPSLLRILMDYTLELYNSIPSYIG
ncbi:MAG: flagellar biosynthesis protein FliQ [Gammaproteobacteria bacterium]|nr:flagellar biosynthesis protein FliQ [Gammaproteobacteria bacterium]